MDSYENETNYDATKYFLELLAKSRTELLAMRNGMAKTTYILKTTKDWNLKADERLQKLSFNPETQ